MSELFRRYPKTDTRQIMSYSSFLAVTGTKTFLCLDQGILEICRYLLNTRGSWPTSYAVEYQDIGYTIPSEEQFQIILNAIGEANLDMASCDDIVTAINGVASQIGTIQGQTGGGCGCIADSGTDVTDFNDHQPELIPGPTDPLPPGFDTREQYDTHRCSAAEYIFDNYVATLRNWATLFGVTGGLTLAVIVGLTLLTVPPAGLALILAALGVIVGLDIGLLAEFSAIADELELDRDTVICDIYEAGTTEEAADMLSQAAVAAVVTVAPTLQSFFEQAVQNLISNEQMEILFDSGAAIPAGSFDCSACSPSSQLATIGEFGCIASIVLGDFTSGTPTEVESCLSTVFGSSRMNMVIGSTASPTNRHFEIVSVDGTNGGIILNWSQGGVSQPQQDWPQLSDLVGLTWDATTLHFVRNTGGDNTQQFNIRFEVTEV